MKKEILQKMFLLCLCIVTFVSCSDDEEGISFNGESLKQTQWSGTMYSYFGGEITGENTYGITFLTSDSGRTSTTDDTGYYTESDFTYDITDNLITFGVSKPEFDALRGYWLLKSFNKDAMELEQSTGEENAYKQVLVLKRTY